MYGKSVHSSYGVEFDGKVHIIEKRHNMNPGSIKANDKLVFILRDPINSIISDGKRTGDLDMGSIQGVLDYFYRNVDTYNLAENKMIVYYEDLMDSARDEIIRVLNFLEEDISTEKIDSFFRDIEKHKKISMKGYSSKEGTITKGLAKYRMEYGIDSKVRDVLLRNLREWTSLNPGMFDRYSRDLDLKLISHRGNISEKNSERENNPNYVQEALDYGFDVEVDVWYVMGHFWLGHDSFQYCIEPEFLVNDRIWCHAKNPEALYEMSKMGGVHYFWHQGDDYTLTSKGIPWVYPGKKLLPGSVCVKPDTGELIPDNCYGICSDEIMKYV